jgi:ankyrin repeat protein
MSWQRWGTVSKWGYPKDAPQEVEKPRTTPLCDACCYGDLQTVCKLMEDESVDVNLSDWVGHTPLFFACRNNKLSVVRTLLKHPNIDVNNRNDKEYCDRFPLYEASKLGHVDVVRELLTSEKLDVNARNSNELTAFIIACSSNEIEVVRELIQHNKIDVNLATELHQKVGFCHCNQTWLL